jgi:NTP pyrophosphatase (non-canonical NTP hydrolase)
MSETDTEHKLRRVSMIGVHLLGLNHSAELIHLNNAHFYRDLATGAPIERNPAEMIALQHSELSEMLEGVRKGGQDKHLPHRSVEEVELADLFIRALDYAAFRKLDLEGAIKDKLAYNVTRQDHTREARLAAGGKKF